MMKIVLKVYRENEILIERSLVDYKHLRDQQMANLNDEEDRKEEWQFVKSSRNYITMTF